jgi:hypothetical protein
MYYCRLVKRNTGEIKQLNLKHDTLRAAVDEGLYLISNEVQMDYFVDLVIEVFNQPISTDTTAGYLTPVYTLTVKSDIRAY